MSSIFFQISKNDFLEASKMYGNASKEFGLRIISFQNGRENYVYLPEVTLNELSVLASILRLAIVPNIRNLDEFHKYLYSGYYGYSTQYY